MMRMTAFSSHKQFQIVGIKATTSNAEVKTTAVCIFRLVIWCTKPYRIRNEINGYNFLFIYLSLICMPQINNRKVNRNENMFIPRKKGNATKNNIIAEPKRRIIWSALKARAKTIYVIVATPLLAISSNKSYKKRVKTELAIRTQLLSGPRYPKWFEMAPNGSKWPRLLLNGPKSKIIDGCTAYFRYSLSG